MSTAWSEELAFLARVESRDPADAGSNNRKCLSDVELAKLRATFPGVPEDYLAYLREVGAGSFRECQYAVYSGFEPPDYFFGDRADRLNQPILCFGDNYSGDPAGFVPGQEWRVVEIWHHDLSVHDTGLSFREFIRKQMLMSPDGSDRRE
jgi:hypothetical protein